MPLHQKILDDVTNQGFAMLDRAVSDELIEEFIQLCQSESCLSRGQNRRESTYGIRNLLTNIPRIREIANESPLITIAKALIGSTAHPVKGIFFDKTPNANWPIPWHQDVTITVQEYRNVAGFEMRPVKDGVVHALPSVSISQQMITLRIHLDDTPVEHGALRVIPGSHREGRLSAEQISLWVKTIKEKSCPLDRGGILLMSPLVLHASSPCLSPGHRRVVHIEYAPSDLPGGLEWAG